MRLNDLNGLAGFGHAVPSKRSSPPAEKWAVCIGGWGRSQGAKGRKIEVFGFEGRAPSPRDPPDRNAPRLAPSQRQSGLARAPSAALAWRGQFVGVVHHASSNATAAPPRVTRRAGLAASLAWRLRGLFRQPRHLSPHQIAVNALAFHQARSAARPHTPFRPAARRFDRNCASSTSGER